MHRRQKADQPCRFRWKILGANTVVYRLFSFSLFPAPRQNFPGVFPRAIPSGARTYPPWKIRGKAGDRGSSSVTQVELRIAATPRHRDRYTRDAVYVNLHVKPR